MLYCELVARPIEGSEMMIQRTSNDKQANSMMKKKRLGQNVYSISIVYKIKHVTLVFKSFFPKLPESYICTFLTIATPKNAFHFLMLKLIRIFYWVL